MKGMKRNSTTFLQSKCFICCLLLLFCLLLTLVLLWTVHITPPTVLPIQNLKHVEYQKADFLCDNIHETCYNEYLYLPMIDVVYTWVNGSDPWLKSNLELTKLKLNISGLTVEADKPLEDFENITDISTNSTGKVKIDERLSASRFQGIFFFFSSVFPFSFWIFTLR